MIYTPTTSWSWSFLLLAILQSCAVLGLEGFVFGAFQNNLDLDVIEKQDKPGAAFMQAQTRTIPTYLTLFIFAHLFLVILCYDALRLKNTIQVIGICIFNAALLVYAAIQMDQIHDANTTFLTFKFDNGIAIKRNLWPVIQPPLIAIPCIIALSTVLMCIICWRLYDEFAWTIYKHISADLKMKERYLKFQIFIALLKFDFFFFVGFTVQFIVIVASTGGFVKTGLGNTGKDYEFFVTIAVLPLTIAFLALAAWCTRREKKVAMGFIVAILFAALAYFIFKLVRMYQNGYEESYKPARRSLTTFAVITLLLIILTIANAIACMLNFGMGLKPHITRKKPVDEEEKHSMTEMTTNPVPSRMTID